MDLESTIDFDFGVRLPFFRGTLQDALRDAQSKARFLLIYLHNPLHENCEDFVQRALGSDDFARLVRERFVLFGEVATSANGCQLAKWLRCTTSPAVAVLFKKHLVCVLQGRGISEPRVLVQELEKGIGAWETLMATEITYLHDREQRELARLREESEQEERMRKDQELLAAFEAREAERRKLEAAQKEEAERQEQARLAALRQRAEEERRAAERELAAKQAEEALDLHRSLAASKTPDPPPADADPSTVLNVQIRFPKGAVERRFYCRDTVEDLYSFSETVPLWSGRPFTLMVSGLPPKPVERAEGGVELSYVAGGQKRLGLLVREN